MIITVILRCYFDTELFIHLSMTVTLITLDTTINQFTALRQVKII